MSYYKTCPRCDCLRDEIMSMTEDECSSVLKLWHDKKAPASSAKADEGKAEKVQPDSALTITENGGIVK